MTTIGVVIPLYRCEPYVRGCLESVLAQTRRVDQIVLVDDCGGDGTVAAATEFLTERKVPFDLVVQPGNGGLGRARNTGLGALRTDLVWFLDSDDQADPRFVEDLAVALDAADADFAVCRTSRIDVDGQLLQIDEKPVVDEVLSGPDYARELLRGNAKGYACTKLFRREILGERPWAEDQAYEDMAPCVRIALSADSVALVDGPLYRYLYRPGSLSTALTESTFDLFTVGDDVHRMVRDAGPGWRRDYLGFWYRQVLTSIAHVAMREHHASGRKPGLYRKALSDVRGRIAFSDVPALLSGRHYRESIFAVLIKVCPGLYSAVLRWR